MSGWGRMWNLTADSTFVDIGSGYGKVVFHAKLRAHCRHVVGIECVTARHLIGEQALDQLREQLTADERVRARAACACVVCMCVCARV
jgi:precorrin-6B methylase 2